MLPLAKGNPTASLHDEYLWDRLVVLTRKQLRDFGIFHVAGIQGLAGAMVKLSQSGTARFERALQTERHPFSCILL